MSRLLKDNLSVEGLKEISDEVKDIAFSLSKEAEKNEELRLLVDKLSGVNKQINGLLFQDGPITEEQLEKLYDLNRHCKEINPQIIEEIVDRPADYSYSKSKGNFVNLWVDREMLRTITYYGHGSYIDDDEADQYEFITHKSVDQYNHYLSGLVMPIVLGKPNEGGITEIGDLDSFKIKKYNVLAKANLQAGYNHWTEGLVYQVTEGIFFFSVTSNEGRMDFPVEARGELLVDDMFELILPIQGN